MAHLVPISSFYIPSYLHRLYDPQSDAILPFFLGQEFEDEPIPVIESDLMRGLDEDDEEPLDAGPTVIEKLDEEVPAAVIQFGDEPADIDDEGNGVEDEETDDDEDIPVALIEVDEPNSTKKAARASVGASRGSTPKTLKSVKGAVSSAGRKRKADAIDEPAAKRPDRGRATAASEAIKMATAKRPRAAPGTKVRHVNNSSDFHPYNLLKAPKAAGVKKAKPGPKPKKAVKEPAEEFEVEAIRDSKSNRKRGELFLVKWKGWPDKANTWEPKENLAHAADILKEYEATREETETEEEKAAPAKKAAGFKKTKAETATKVALAKKAAATKPATTSRGRAGRPRRN